MTDRNTENPPRKFLSALESEIPRLRRHAISLTGNLSDADDLAQDCLCRAIEKWHQWEPGTNLRAWLFTIQRNIFLSGVRRQARINNASPEIKRHTADCTPSDQLDAFFVGQVDIALKGLPYEQREVVILVAVEGMAYDDVAAIVGVPIGTIRSRLSRARESLRAAVNEENVDFLRSVN